MIKYCQSRVTLLVFVALSTLVYANESEAPDIELLEFLAEFSDVQDDDFEMLIFHALEDSQTAAKAIEEEKSDE